MNQHSTTGSASGTAGAGSATGQQQRVEQELTDTVVAA